MAGPAVCCLMMYLCGNVTGLVNLFPIQIKTLFIVAPTMESFTVSIRVLNLLENKICGAVLQYMGLSIQAKILLITRAGFKLYLFLDLFYHVLVRYSSI